MSRQRKVGLSPRINATTLPSGGGELELHISQFCKYREIMLFLPGGQVMDCCSQKRVAVWQALEARSYFQQIQLRFVQPEISSFKDPVRLLPCDLTSDDQLVELGQTDGTDLLVIIFFPFVCRLIPSFCQLPINLPFWEARMKKSRDMELKLAKVGIS